MKTTVEFLNAVKARYDIPTDGRLAVKVGLTRSAISRFMAGKDHLGDESAMRVADLLDLDPAYVVACVHIERAKRQEEKALWSRIATLTAGIAAALAVVAFLPFVDMSGSGFGFLAVTADSGALYIMSNRNAKDLSGLSRDARGPLCLSGTQNQASLGRI